MEKITGLQYEVGKDPKILILGTMPGSQSLEKKEYYSSPNNSFWAILGSLFNDGKPFQNYDEKRKCLHDNHIALWDVFDSCKRDKSIDKNIKDPVYNDIEGMLADNPSISLIIFNGKKAEDAYKKHFKLNVKTVTDPSTSNAFPLSREKKTALWKEAFGLSKEEKPVETLQNEEGTTRSLEMTITGAPYIITMPIMEDEWEKDAKKLIKECDEENGKTDFRVDFYGNKFRDHWDDEMMIVLYDENVPVNIEIQDRETEETVDQFTQNDVPLKTCDDVVLSAGDIFFIKKCEDAKSYFSAKTVYSRDVFSFTKVKVKVGDRMMEGLVPFDFADEDAFFNEMFTDFEIYNTCDDYTEKKEGLYIKLDGDYTVIGEDSRPSIKKNVPDNNTPISNNQNNTEKMNIRIEISGRGNIFNIVSPSSLENNEDWKDAIKPLIEQSEEEGEAIEDLDEFEVFQMEYMDDCEELMLYTPEEDHPIYVKVIDTDSDEVIDEFTSNDVEFTDNNDTINGGYICRKAYVYAGQLAVDLYDVEYSRDNFTFNKVSVKIGDQCFENRIEVGYEYYDEDAEYDTDAMFDIESYDEKNASLIVDLDGELYEF